MIIFKLYLLWNSNNKKNMLPGPLDCIMWSCQNDVWPLSRLIYLAFFSILCLLSVLNKSIIKLLHNTSMQSAMINTSLNKTVDFIL